MTCSISKLGAVILFLVMVSEAAEAQFHLSIKNQFFQVDNMTAGGRVAVLGVIHEFPGMTVHVSSPFQTGIDSDGDESATMMFGEAISPCSVFVAVDLTTGHSALGSYLDPARQECGKKQDVKVTPNSAFSDSGLELYGDLISIMFVRPGVGVWRTQVGDGGPFDADGTPNGKILLPVESLARDDDPEPPPAKFRNGDVIVTIETFTRESSIHVLNQDIGTAGTAGTGWGG